MANTLVYGLTVSGTALPANEDAFYLSGSIRPELLGGQEHQSVKFIDRQQLFIVADGFGGPGAGDLAARIVFQVANQAFDRLRDDTIPFDFSSWVKQLMAEADRRIEKDLQARAFGRAGCSVALLLLVDDVAYTMSLGSASVYVLRDGQLYVQAAPQEDESGAPLIHLGKRQADDVPVAQNIKKLDLLADDQFFLMTDGMYRNLSLWELREAVVVDLPFKARVEDLFASAIAKNDRDNKTLVAVKIQEVKHYAQAATPKVNDEHRAFKRPDADELAAFSKIHRGANYEKEYERRTDPVKVVVEYAHDDKEATAPQRRRVSDQQSEYNRPPREAEPEERGGLVSTFFKSLLLGLLIGLAIMLTLWFIFLS